MSGKTQLCIYIGAARIQAMAIPAAGQASLLLDTAFAGIDAGSGAAAAGALLLGEALAEVAAHEAVRGARCRVMLSDRWLASAAMPWNSSQHAAGSARAGAVSYLMAAGYDSLADDTIRFDDAPWRAPRLVLAYPGSLLAELAGWARLAGCTLDSVLSIAGVAALLQPAAGAAARSVSAVLEPGAPGSTAYGVFLKWTASGERVEEVSARPLVAFGTAADAAAAVVRRLYWNSAEAGDAPPLEIVDLSVDSAGAAGVAGGLPAPLRWWQDCLSGPRGGRSLALDAVARVPGWTGKRVAVAAAVLLLCGLAATGLALDHGELRRQRAAVAPSPSAVPASAPTREQQRKVVAVNAAVSELNVPLPLLMRALQPPKDIRVALLGLELGATGSDSARPTLKVAVESPGSQDMTMYVAFLGYRKPFSKAYLVKHELVTGADGTASYRFVVEVEWKD
jgi:hypothetical protein